LKDILAQILGVFALDQVKDFASREKLEWKSQITKSYEQYLDM
jgi:hypothetical protein